MLKHIWLCAACLLGGPLAAEAVGNVELQFPPSNYEWRLFADDSILGSSFFDDEDDFDVPPDYQWGTPLDDEEEDCDAKPNFKMFTHREGDALEIFVAYSSDPDCDEEDDEVETLEIAQMEIDQILSQFLPNHRVILRSVVSDKESGFVDWELNDGMQDIMHGYSRIFKAKRDDGVERLIVLGYLTTAIQTEHNRSVWTNVLNQARISN